MATVPAFLAFGCVYGSIKWGVSLFSRQKEARNVVRRIRYTLASMERLLLLSKPPYMDENYIHAGATILKLRDADLGNLMLLLFRLEKELIIGK